MIHQARFILFAFLVAVTAGCAHQSQAPQLTESERIAAEYPDADQLSIAADTSTSEPRVMATGMDQPRSDVRPDVYRDQPFSKVEVLRGGRYALVTASPTLQQRDLLEQTVNTAIPASLNPTVEDAIRYTLQHTGYSLCRAQGKPQQFLYHQPLPAAHYRLGPMPLREALQILAGPAFEVQADPIARYICYQVRDQRLVKG